MSHAVAVPTERAKRSGPRLTRNDRVVLSCLEKHNSPLKAYDLLECLREEGINAPMTVYRALGRLASQGRVRKIESLNAYYAVPQDGSGAFGAFLICQTCGVVGFRLLGSDVLRQIAPDLTIGDASIELRVGCVDKAAERLSGSCSSDGT